MADSANFEVMVVDDVKTNIDILVELLGEDYEVSVAMDGESALQDIAENQPDLILLDIMMPAMDGYEVCRRIKANDKSKDIPVIFITAKTDVEDEVKGLLLGAVDYITKPISPARVKARVKTQVQLLNAQRKLKEMLENTFAGSIKILTDILAISNPTIFSRTLRLKRYVSGIIDELNLSNRWQFEIAAMLSQLGCLGVPLEILEKINAGHDISSSEREAFESHCKVGGELLSRIPHLEAIAAMISAQMAIRKVPPGRFDILNTDELELGSRILQTVVAFDKLIIDGMLPSEAIRQLLTDKKHFADIIVKALQKVVRHINFEMDTRTISINNLVVGMIIDEDVMSESGKLLLSKGSEISETIIRSLQRFSQHGKVRGSILVKLPK